MNPIKFTYLPNMREVEQVAEIDIIKTLKIIRSGVLEVKIRHSFFSATGLPRPSPLPILQLSALVEKIRNPRFASVQSELKKCLPAFLPTGVFSVAVNDGLVTPSGIYSVDFDYLDAVATKETLSQDPHTLAAFISARGNGVKLLVRVEPAPVNNEESHEFFKQLKSYYAGVGLALAADNTPDIRRLVYFSYDPDIYYRKVALAQPFEYNKLLFKVAMPARRIYNKEGDELDYEAIYTDLVEKYSGTGEGLYNQYQLKISTAFKNCGREDLAVAFWIDTRGLSEKEAEYKVRGLTGKSGAGSLVYYKNLEI